MGCRFAVDADDALGLNLGGGTFTVHALAARRVAFLIQITELVHWTKVDRTGTQQAISIKAIGGSTIFWE